MKKNARLGGIESASNPSKPRIRHVFELLGPTPVNLDRLQDLDFSTFRTGLSQDLFRKSDTENPNLGLDNPNLESDKFDVGLILLEVFSSYLEI